MWCIASPGLHLSSCAVRPLTNLVRCKFYATCVCRFLFRIFSHGAGVLVLQTLVYVVSCAAGNRRIIAVCVCGNAGGGTCCQGRSRIFYSCSLSNEVNTALISRQFNSSSL